MSVSRWGPVLWIAAGALSIVLTAAFRTEQWQIAATVIAGLAAIVLGALILRAASQMAIAPSSALGAVWLVVYVILTYVQAGELVAAGTDVFLGLMGVAAAVLVYRGSRRRA